MRERFRIPISPQSQASFTTPCTAESPASGDRAGTFSPLPPVRIMRYEIGIGFGIYMPMRAAEF
jgi:hypothetical protein